MSIVMTQDLRRFLDSEWGARMVLIAHLFSANPTITFAKKKYNANELATYINPEIKEKLKLTENFFEGQR